MGPIKTRSWGLGLILLGVVSVVAYADTPSPSSAPASLRMRRPAKPARWSPMQWAKRVAQLAPAPADDPAPPSGDTPSAPPADSPPASPPAAEPAAEPAPVPDQTPTPATEPAPAAAAPAPAPAATLTAKQSPDLTDEELAKLSESAAKEEIITV